MKKPFKKLIKHSKKFRKQHGLSKNDFTHKITVNPKDQKEVIGLLRMAHDLDDAVGQCRSHRTARGIRRYRNH